MPSVFIQDSIAGFLLISVFIDVFVLSGVCLVRSEFSMLSLTYGALLILGISVIFAALPLFTRGVPHFPEPITTVRIASVLVHLILFVAIGKVAFKTEDHH